MIQYPTIRIMYWDHSFYSYVTGSGYLIVLFPNEDSILGYSLNEFGEKKIPEYYCKTLREAIGIVKKYYKVKNSKAMVTESIDNKKIYWFNIYD